MSGRLRYPDSKIIDGQLTVKRNYGHEDAPGSVEIRIFDKEAGLEFLSLTISSEDFLNASLGQMASDCTFITRGLHLVGGKRETKEEFVPFDGRDSNGPEAAAAVAPFEVDGWKARSGDFGNHHRYVNLDREDDGVKGYMVVFTRTLPPEETK